MTPDPLSSPPPDGVPASRRALKVDLPRARAYALSGAVAVLGLLAASCGGGGGDSAAQVEVGASANTAAETAPSSEFMNTRSGAGIAAAGGNLQAVQGEDPCGKPDSESLTIAYVGADLDALEGLNLEGLVVEDPGLIIDAYRNEVNFNGGIGGRCVEFVAHYWSPVDLAGTFTQICIEMPQQQPLVYFALRVFDPTLQCATIGAQIPTVGLFTSPPSSTFELTGDRLFVDDGSVERLLSATIDVALNSGMISTGDAVGLLHGTPDMPASVRIIESRGLDSAAVAHVPPEFADLGLLLHERQVRLLEDGLTAEERAEADRYRAALPPELTGVYEAMEQFFLDAANRFRDAGVDKVVATADWTDLRRFMRAADLIGWLPQWITNDIQPVSVVLLGAPERQAGKLLQVSNRRAAGDEVPDLDQGCLTLRNTATVAGPFAHRVHTDAWALLTATCDYLDIVFSAMTSLEGDITPGTFVEALRNSSHEPGFGGRITFSPEDFDGADRFRVLEADPSCVLNDWGCMRATTDWMTPSEPVGAGAG